MAALLEVGAYYVPLIDNFLDVLAGPLAVVAGVVATAAVITDLPPWCDGLWPLLREVERRESSKLCRLSFASKARR